VAKLKRRERNVILECSECKERNYTTPFKLKGGKKLELKKHCPSCGKHTPHRGRRMD
jgi:large subunit ribosomal protein L33